MIDERWRSFRQERAGRRCVTDQRVTGMILHPLAEVGVGMFVPIMVGSRQLVVNLQRGGKGRHREQHKDKQQRNDRAGFWMCKMTKHERPTRRIREARVVTKGPLRMQADPLRCSYTGLYPTEFDILTSTLELPRELARPFNKDHHDQADR